MAYNEDKYKKYFESRYGAGSFDASLSSARDIGKTMAQAKIAKMEFERRKKEAENKTYQDALTSWNDPAANTLIKRDGSELTIDGMKKEGAARTAEEIRNDPFLKEQIEQKGYNLEDYINSMYDTLSKGQFTSERDYKKFSERLQATTNQENKARDKEYKNKYGMNYQDYSDFKAAQEEAKASKKDERGFLGSLKDFMTSKDVDDDGERDGLLGAIDRYIAPISKAATDTLQPGNTERMAANQKEKYGEVRNPVTKAVQKDRGLETDILHGIGTFAAFAAPYSQAYKAANLAVNKIPKLANIANPYAKSAVTGATAGGIAEAGVSGLNEFVAPEANDMGDYALRTGLGIAGGAILDPAILGIANIIKRGRGAARAVQDQPVDETLALPEPQEQLALPEPQLRLQGPVTPEPSLDNLRVMFSRPSGLENPIPRFPSQVRQAIRQDEFQNAGLGFAQQGRNVPQTRGQQQAFNLSRGDSELLGQRADDLLDNVSQVETSPSGSFESRLREVQNTMRTADNSAKTAQSRVKEYTNELKDAVQKQFDYLKSSMGKGTQKGGLVRDREGYVTGAYGRVSNNPHWYQEFYRLNGRKPNNSELRELAEQQVRNGFKDEFGEVPKYLPKAVQEIDNQLDEIATMIDENPGNEEAFEPIVEALMRDRDAILSEFDEVINGQTPNRASVDELYQGARNSEDPATFDKLVKLNQLESNYNKNRPVQGPRESTLKDSLDQDPRIKESIQKMSPPERPISRQASLDEMFKRMEELAPAKKSEPSLEPLQFRRKSDMERQIPQGSNNQAPSLERLSALRENAANNGRLLSLKPTTLKSVKTKKLVETMSKDELQGVYKQLEEQQASISAGKGSKKQLEAIQEDMKKVEDLLMKLDLQTFGKKADKPKPEKKSKPAEQKVKNSSEQPLNIEELQKVKDISHLQVGTTDLYRIIDQLPERQSTRLKTKLDTAKKANIDFQNKITDELHEKISKGLKIKKGSKESALVQDFGEKTLVKKYLRKRGIDPKKLSDAELSKINLQQLKKSRPDDWQQIVAADNFFRQTYNDLIDQVNKVRSEIYPNNPDKQVPKRSDYYHHFNELEGFEGIKNLFDTPASIDPHLEGVSPYTRPSTKFQGFMQKRGLGPYKSDAVGGFLKYLKAASHSINIDPVIPVLKKTADEIADATEDTRNANKIIEALQDHANDLAGKTNPYDRLMQKLLGRKGSRIANTLNSRVKSNMIVGNLSSALGQLGSVPLGVGKAKQHSAAGLRDTLTQAASHLLSKGTNKSAPVYKSDFLKERFSDRMYRRFDQRLLDQPKKLAVWVLETADKSGTNFIWNSMYNKGLKEGVEDAVKYADVETRKLVAGRGVAEVPLLQKAKTTQIFAPFTLEVGNQWRVLKDMVGEKDAAGILTFLIASYGLNEAMENIRGSSVSFDPVGAVKEGYTKADGGAGSKALGAAASLNGEVVGNIPFGNLLTQFANTDKKVPGTDLQFKELFGERDPNRFGTGLTAAKAFQDPLYALLPFGASQIRKTTKGIDAMASEGTYKGDSNFIPFAGEEKELMYPVGKGSLDRLKLLAFGTSSTSDAREYYDNEHRPLSEKQTKQYEMNKSLGTEKEYYNNLLTKRRVDSLRKKITEVQKDKELSPEEKEKEILMLMEELEKIQK